MYRLKQTQGTTNLLLSPPFLIHWEKMGYGHFVDSRRIEAIMSAAAACRQKVEQRHVEGVGNFDSQLIGVPTLLTCVCIRVSDGA